MFDGSERNRNYNNFTKSGSLTGGTYFASDHWPEAEYLEQQGVPKTPADLIYHDCLVYGIWSPHTPCRWVFNKQGKIEEVRPEGRFRSNDWRALLHAAVKGYGFTLGPEDVLKDEIKHGRLVQVLPNYEGPCRPMHVLIPPGRRQTTKISSFVKAIIQEFDSTK